jgi:DNA-binding NtrC family response regulator
MTEAEDDIRKTRSLAPEKGHRGADRFYLLVVQGGSSSMFHLPRTGVVVVGRALDADLCLQDTAASRRHAKIMTAEGEARVVDLGSYNGTYVNGERIEGSRTMTSGDVISIGEATLILHAGSKQAAGHPVVDLGQLRQRLEEEIERAMRYQRPLTVAEILVGKSGADREQLARTATAQLRLIDIVGWMAEGRLVVVIPELAGDAVAPTADLVLEAVARIAPEVRIGLATCPADGCDSDTLLAAARSAAAAAKPRGIAAAVDAARRIQLGDRAITVADPAMARLFDLIQRLASSDLPILVQGETGAGKENAAFAVHAWSPRAKAPFVALNCAAIPESLVESELFGYEKGAFSGATGAKPGRLEAADGGTVFLDEVGEVPLAVQAKLLRALEAKRVTRLGDVREREIDIRIVAATNRNLEEEVRGGRFRQDLFFRLGAATVVLPPLRERPREIPILARTFLAEACTKSGREPPMLSPASMHKLATYGWPGNVRELKHVMEYVAAATAEDVIEPWDLPEKVGGGTEAEAAAPTVPPLESAAAAMLGVSPSSISISGAMGSRPVAGGVAEVGAPSQPGEEPGRAPTDGPARPGPGTLPPRSFRPVAEEIRALERKRMTEALEAAGGVQRRAAELIGMPLRTFVLKLKQYGIQTRSLRRE